MKHIIISIIVIMFSFSASAKEVVIDMLNKRDDGQKMVFSQDIANIDVGDSIKWLPTNKGHNVEFVGGPDGASLPARSGLNKEVVITRGEKGAIAIKGSKTYEYPAKENLKISDLTGAGDLFAAGYLHGVINKLSVEESLSHGTELSSKIIQKIGARI